MILSNTSYGIKKTGVSASIPNNSVAKLMYYLNSVCALIPIDQDGKISHLRRYSNYNQLDNDDINSLLQICVLVHPKVLLNKCMFVAPELCQDCSNEFYELEQVENILGLSQNIVIGGQNTKVSKIMACKICWLENHFYNPLNDVLAQRKREEEAKQALKRAILSSQTRIVVQKKDDCSIM